VLSSAHISKLSLTLYSFWEDTSCATRIFQQVMEQHGLLTCSQEASTDPYPEPNQYSPYRPIHFNIMRPFMPWFSWSSLSFWRKSRNNYYEFCVTAVFLWTPATVHAFRALVDKHFKYVRKLILPTAFLWARKSWRSYMWNWLPLFS
jgi:hypothetical protein